VQSKSKLLVHFLVLALLHFDGCSLVLQGLTGCRRCIVFFPLRYCFSLCLQCFDTVGWAAGRASGL